MALIQPDEERNTQWKFCPALLVHIANHIIYNMLHRWTAFFPCLKRTKLLAIFADYADFRHVPPFNINIISH